MGLTAFFDEWLFDGGVVGTDVLKNYSLSLSGGACVHFPSSASSNVTLYSEWLAIPVRTARVTSSWYSVWLAAYADSIASTSRVRLAVETADAARSTISSTVLYDAAMPNLSRYDSIGSVFSMPFNQHWIRYRIDRPDSIAFNLYVDSVEIKQAPAGGQRGGASSVVFPTSWSTVNPAGGLLHGFSSTSGDLLRTEAPGKYALSAQVQLDGSYVDGDMFGIRLATYSSAGTPYSYFYGSSVTIPAAYNAGTNELGLAASGQEFFDCLASEVNYPVSVGVEVIQYTNTGTPKALGRVQLQAARITDR